MIDVIDLEFAIEKFALFSGMSIVEAQRQRGLVSASVIKLSQSIKADAPKQAKPLLAQCAAADAYYAYCLCECTRDDAAVTAGSVTVRSDAKAKAEAARALRDAALCNAAPYLNDGGFAFLHA